MAEQHQHQCGVELDQSQFCCSVCLDLLKEPVAIQCGHSYCRSCIEGCWDQEEKKGKYSCPQCRETFNSRPVLNRNNMLAEVVEKLKKNTQPTQQPAAQTCVDSADVACDFCCANKPNKATMSCLMCLASYCPAHLKPHYSVPVLKKHQLVSAAIPLQRKMCTKHNKLMEVYCQTDKMCICYLCTVDEHRCHITISAVAERTKEQIQLIANQKQVQKKEKERVEELSELVQAVKDFKSEIQTTVKSCDKVFDELTASIKKKLTSVKQLIEAQEKTAVAEAEDLQQQLEEEITKLRKRDADLEELSHTDDHVHFIQTFQSLSTSCESPDLPPGAVVRPRHSVKALTDCVSELRDNIERLLVDTWPKISATGVVLPPVPKTRAEFISYSCPLSLDQNSVYRYLSLSQDYRRVTEQACENYYSSNSERFTNVNQVLCSEALTGRCYWEVSFTGHVWSVAASYKDVCRSSHGSKFGENNKSWSLKCSSNGYTFQHNSVVKAVTGPQSSRIGVYLDYKSGTLCFYSVSDTMTLLHKEQTTFTQPLHPGLGLSAVDSWSRRNYYAELLKLW